MTTPAEVPWYDDMHRRPTEKPNTNRFLMDGLLLTWLRARSDTLNETYGEEPYTLEFDLVERDSEGEVVEQLGRVKLAVIDITPGRTS